MSRSSILVSVSVFHPLRALILAFVLPVALGLGGCLTTEMWSDDGPSEDVDDRVEYDESASRGSGIPVWGKVLLTPVTLVVDIVMLPVIAFLDDPFAALFDDDDDEDQYARDHESKVPRQPPTTPPPAKPQPTDAKAKQPVEGR